MVPFIFMDSNNLKVGASDFDIDVVYKNDYRLSRLVGCGGSMTSGRGPKHRHLIVIKLH